MNTFRRYLALLVLITICSPAVSQAATVSGPLNKWAPIDIDFVGPLASESDNSPNPFLDYRLTVKFTSPSGNTVSVPGFFAGDGEGGDTGTVWRARFSADEVGTWRYNATLAEGTNVAIELSANAGSNTNLQGSSGEFRIEPAAADAPGFLSKGRLEYVGEHYLKFRDGSYWIKGGTDSPENFMGFAGIDGTFDSGGINSNFLHNYQNHIADYKGDGPQFSHSSTGVDSKGIIGALNYLAGVGVNSIYFLPMNLGGDGQETYPFVGSGNTRFNKTHYDLSKLHQWNQVFQHAQVKGIALQFVLTETEAANEQWFDGGAMGLERKLFFRELVARFGYLLAVKWNLGEESEFPVSELRKHADYLQAIDWTNKPITVHNVPNDFSDYEQLAGDSRFSATSIQYQPNNAGALVENWRRTSANNGRPWVLDMDENLGGVTAGNAALRRKQILYDVYFSGGNIEWYFGYHPLPVGGDVTAGDFRQREPVWTYMRHARNFMQRELPFWLMNPADDLVTNEPDDLGGAEVLALSGDIYAIYLPATTGSVQLNLNGASGQFSLRWYNPVTGEFAGSTKSVTGGSSVAIGNPPSRSNDDWVVLVKREGFAFTRPANNTNSDQAAPASSDQTEPSAENAQTQSNTSGITPGLNWRDSYSANGACYCATTFDHDIGGVLVPTPAGNKTVREVCAAIGPGPGIGNNPIYNDVQCGNGPPNSAPGNDEVLCPGRVDQGAAGCGVIGPRWDLQSVFGGAGGTTQDEPEPSDEPDEDTTNEPDEPDGSGDSGTPAESEGTEPDEPDGSNDSSTPAESEGSESPVENDTADEVAVNSPPEFSPLSLPSAIPGSELTFTVVASDADGVAPVMAVESVPGGMTAESVADGALRFNWPVPSDATGSVEVIVTAIDYDNRDTRVSNQISIPIADAPAVGDEPNAPTSPDTNTTENDAANNNNEELPVPHPINDGEEEDSDASNSANMGDRPESGDGNLLFVYGADNVSVMVGERYRQVIIPIDSTGVVPALWTLELPAGATFEDNGNGSRTLAWAPAPSDLGFHELTIIAASATNLDKRIELTKTIEVIDQTIDTAPAYQPHNPDAKMNFPPVFLPIEDQQLAVGATLNVDVMPIDPEGFVPILHMTNVLPGATFSDNGRGGRTLKWTPTESAIGDYTIEFVAIDSRETELSSRMTLGVTVSAP